MQAARTVYVYYRERAAGYELQSAGHYSGNEFSRNVSSRTSPRVSSPPCRDSPALRAREIESATLERILDRVCFAFDKSFLLFLGWFGDRSGFGFRLGGTNCARDFS